MVRVKCNGSGLVLVKALALALVLVLFVKLCKDKAKVLIRDFLKDYVLLMK